VRELLRCRAAVNAVMYDKRTALHLSAAEGHDSVVSFLLKNGADAGFQDRWGGSALLDATRGNHLACVELLRDAGVSDAFADASGGALHHLGLFLIFLRTERLALGLSCLGGCAHLNKGGASCL